MIGRICLLILVIFGFQISETSAQYWVKGRIIDKEIGKPIPQANVINKAGNKIAETDKNGWFQIELTDKKSTLRFSHVSFRDTTLNLQKSNWLADTIFVEVRLEYDLIQINTALVESDPLPEVIFSNDTLHVGDFVFVNDEILLLTYGKEDRWKRQEHSKLTPFSQCSLVLQDSSGNEVAVQELNGEFLSLEKTYNDKVLIHSLKKHYLIDDLHSNFQIAEVDDQTYLKAFVPVLDSLKQFILLSDYSPDFPSFSYYAYHPADSTYAEIRKIEDELQMQLLRSEYKYLPTRGKLDAFRMELKSGIDKEIIAAWMTGFSESLYAESLYAPCIVVNDTLCIFNHYNDHLFKHTNAEFTSDSTSFNYHKTSTNGKWKKDLLHDQIQEKIFVQYDKHGYTYLCELNLLDGSVGEAFRLKYRYPEKVKVFNNRVYYLYRPYGSSQKHYLYRERLR